MRVDAFSISLTWPTIAQREKELLSLTFLWISKLPKNKRGVWLVNSQLDLRSKCHKPASLYKLSSKPMMMMIQKKKTSQQITILLIQQKGHENTWLSCGENKKLGFEANKSKENFF